MSEQIEMLKKVNVELLTNTQTIKSLTEKINEIINTINTMPAPRDRGPISQRDMTEDDAKRVLMGNMADVSTKKCAEQMNLSYGQVYSARNGFTFKSVYDSFIKSKSVKK